MSSTGRWKAKSLSDCFEDYNGKNSHLVQAGANVLVEARDVVNRIKAKFGKAVRVDLLVKNLDGSERFYRENIDKI